MQENTCPACGEGLYMNLDGQRGTCSRCQREWNVADVAHHVVDVADPMTESEPIEKPKRMRVLKRQK